MMSDKRYDKESKEVSDYAEPYSVCNNVYMQHAMALGNITSKRKEKAEEANAADEPDKKGGDGRRGKERGKKDNATVALKGDAEANALVQLTLRETAHGARIATSNTSRLMI